MVTVIHSGFIVKILGHTEAGTVHNMTALMSHRAAQTGRSTKKNCFNPVNIRYQTITTHSTFPVSQISVDREFHQVDGDDGDTLVQGERLRFSIKLPLLPVEFKKCIFSLCS